MNIKIPQNYEDLLLGTHFASVATLNKDGSIHNTPMWIDYDGEFILLNTAVGRTKYYNMLKRKHVGICIIDRENGYRYLSIIGNVVKTEFEGAEEHIKALAKRYWGPEKPFPLKENEKRVKFYIQVTKVLT